MHESLPLRGEFYSRSADTTVIWRLAPACGCTTPAQAFAYHRSRPRSRILLECRPAHDAIFPSSQTWTPTLCPMRCRRVPLQCRARANVPQQQGPFHPHARAVPCQGPDSSSAAGARLSSPHNRRAMRRLNRQFRGKDKATDVLSFPAEASGASEKHCRRSGHQRAHGATAGRRAGPALATESRS